jgi:hypothetical protein
MRDILFIILQNREKVQRIIYYSLGVLLFESSLILCFNGISDNSSNDEITKSKKITRPSGTKYTKFYKNNQSLSPFYREALIGLLLGDVYASRSKANHNTRLVFDQSEDKHSEYLNYLYNLFEPFVGSPPKATNRKPDKRTGKVYNSPGAA